MAALERKKIDIYQRIKEDFLIPLFSSSDAETAKKVLNAVVDGGSRIIEMTHREAGSYEVFKKVASDRAFRDVLLGAGSVIDEPTAAMYVDAGASFIVGPNFNSRIMRLCNRINLLYIPGCGSMNEVVTAYEEGAVVVKIFPAGEMGGPGFLKSISAPCPWIEAIPTGGVEPTEENLKGWIEAGAVAVGMGSKLIQKGFIKAQQWNKIKELVADTLKLISSIKTI